MPGCDTKHIVIAILIVLLIVYMYYTTVTSYTVFETQLCRLWSGIPEFLQAANLGIFYLLIDSQYPIGYVLIVDVDGEVIYDDFIRIQETNICCAYWSAFTSMITGIYNRNIQITPVDGSKYQLPFNSNLVLQLESGTLLIREKNGQVVALLN